MKKLLALFLSLLMIAAFFTSCSGSSSGPGDKYADSEIYYEATPKKNIKESKTGAKYADNEILIVANEDFDKSDVEELAKKYDAQIVGYIEITGDYQLKFKKAYTYDQLQDLIKQLEAEECVKDASLQTFLEIEEESYKLPNDARWQNEWDALNPEGENWGIEAINAPFAWNYTSEMTPVKLGLIDTMFNTTNKDLQFAETYYNPDQSKITCDHGTHVAGTMAAIYNNNKGITGVYPFGTDGDESNLYGVAFKGTADSGSMFYWKVAFTTLIANDVKVINMSLGCGNKLRVFLASKGYKAIQKDFKEDADVLGDFLQSLLDIGYDFVITKSAGNNGDEHFKKTGSSKSYPYGWEVVETGGVTSVYGLADWGQTVNVIDNPDVKDRIIVVGASELKKSGKKSTYSLAEFSSTGDRVDVIAPGVNITSCGLKTEYVSMNGTSMAAPHVAGAAATLWAFNPDMSGKRLKEILVGTASTSVAKTGVGMINMLDAMMLVAQERQGGNPFTSQKGIITANVYGSGKLQKDAKVEIYNADSDKLVATQVTGASGSFTASLDGGSYYLVVSKDGFDNKKVENISIKSGGAACLDNIILSELVSDFTVPSEKIVTLGEVDVIEPVTNPKDAVGYTMKWTSSNEKVATVSPTGEAGVINALSKGTTTITATLTSGGKTIKKTTTVRVASQARDTVLVLDISGSMSGRPLEEMKKSAVKFCNDLLKDEFNNRVGIVFYDTDIQTINLTDDLEHLISRINAIDDDGRTDMEAGLSAADRMLKNYGRKDSIKNVVIMADGVPNEGKTSHSNSLPYGSYYDDYEYYVEYANAVIDTAKGMSGYNIYSLGFFHGMTAEDKAFTSALMKALTNKKDGYRQVESAENLQFAFGDIKEEISIGSKIVINIACPVDVKVSCGGEVLSSAPGDFNSSTTFGTLQLVGKNKDIKVVTLDSSKKYDVELVGTGEGKMDYSVNYFNKKEQLYDYRSFETVPITTTTKITSKTDNSKKDVELNIDQDGDGEVDVVWTALKKGIGKITYEKNPKPEIQPITVETDNTSAWIIILVCGLLVAIIAVVMTTIVITSRKGKTVQDNEEAAYVTPQYVLQATPETETEVHEKEITGCIKVMTGSMRGYDIPIRDKETLYLGKDAKFANLVFTSDYRHVSRVHCSITYDALTNKYFVTDDSSNGTYAINHQRFVKGRRTMVVANSTIILGNEDCIILLG